MTAALGVLSPRQLHAIRLHDRVLAVAAAILCGSPVLKFAEIQYLELIFIADLFLIALFLLFNPIRLRLFTPLLWIARRWAIFSVLALILSTFSLGGYFNLTAVGTLKYPVVIAISRIIELFVDVFFMLYFASAFLKDMSLCRFFARAYWLSGIAGCAYAVLSYLVSLVGLHLSGVAAADQRFEGFDNEGGPFGIYLISVIVLTLAMQHLGWLKRKSAVLSIVLFCFSLFESGSKAAFCCVGALALVMLFLRLSWPKFILGAACVVAALTGAAMAFELPAKVAPYLSAIDEYIYVAASRPDDMNYVAGRASGLFLAPTMIATHPYIGIGLGNYPIVRNDPQYRRGTPLVVLSNDAPGLGAVDYLVDLGVPLFLFFLWVEFVPAVTAARQNANVWVVNLLLMQPVANVFGAHLNLIYPWMAASVALGILYTAAHAPAATHAE